MAILPFYDVISIFKDCLDNFQVLQTAQTVRICPRRIYGDADSKMCSDVSSWSLSIQLYFKKQVACGCYDIHLSSAP